MTVLLEDLTSPERDLRPEEAALAGLLERLIVDYDDRHYAIPEGDPHETLAYLMEQRAGARRTG